MRARLLIVVTACALAIAGSVADVAAGLSPGPGCHRVCVRKQLTGVPASCRNESFVAHFRQLRRRPGGFRFYLDGRLVRSTTKGRFDVRIRCSPLRAGRHEIEVTVARPAPDGTLLPYRTFSTAAFIVR